MNIALLNCDPMPEPDPDEAPLLAALKSAGHDAESVAWNTSEPGVVSAFDAVLLRATWDYYHDLPRFLDWIERAAAHSVILNPVEVVRHNAHKGYLSELAERGIATVPTEIVKRGEAARLAVLCSARGWSDVVVKPAVGAGSFLTMRTNADDAAGQTHLEEILRTRDAMVQPFISSVATSGERSIACYRGVPHHAVHKLPRFKGEDESVHEAELSESLEAFARSVLEAAGAEGLLYARVDCFEGEDGAPLLSELELIEPSLYFSLSPRAAEDFVTHLEHYLELASGA